MEKGPRKGKRETPRREGEALRKGKEKAGFYIIFLVRVVVALIDSSPTLPSSCLAALAGRVVFRQTSQIRSFCHSGEGRKRTCQTAANQKHEGRVCLFLSSPALETTGPSTRYAR